MRSSEEHKAVRNFLDFWRSLLLRAKKFMHRRFYKYRVRPIRIAIIAGVLIFSFFVVRGIFTRAEVTDFYPATCLGDWQDPQNAQGEPENFRSDPVQFDGSNSSIYAGGEHKIFCGNFLPQDYDAKGDLISAGLTFVWRVGEEQNTEPPAAPTTVPPPDAAPQTDVAPPAEIAPSVISPEGAVEPAPAVPPSPPQDVPAPTTRINGQRFSFLNHLLRSVFAQETVSNEVQAVTTPTPEETVAPELIISPAEIAPEFVPETQPESVPNSDSETEPEATPPLPPPPDDHFLAISYSLDGQEWFLLDKVNADNWPNFTLTLPIKSWDELAKLQISIEGIPTSLSSVPKTFLDGMLIEAHYDLPPILQKVETITPEIQNEPKIPVITLPEDQAPVPADSKRSTFGAQESPAFDLNLDDLPTPTSSASSSAPLPGSMPSQGSNSSSTSMHGGLRLAARNFFLNFFKFGSPASAQTAQGNLPTVTNPIVAEIYEPSGKRTGIQPTFLTVGNQLRITVPEPSVSFKPGKYALRLWVFRHGTIYYTENNFTWGVLVVNFNKSIYAPGDQGTMGFGVLDNGGHTICDAGLDASITEPSGKVQKFSTRNKTIAYSASCGAQTITNEADYSANFIPTETGKYIVRVAADTQNGTRVIEDAFEVQNTPAFDVERFAPTRIYPPALYKVSILITANEDFKGNIVEVIPASFKLITERQTVSATQSDTQTVSWPVDLKRGDKTELTYFFDAPDVSPELYKLGPLAIGAWQEARKWQIASDAAGEVILLWDGGSTLPAGWTCISCAANDAFKDVMPRVSSTYANASSGVNTNTHTLTFNNASATALTSAGNTATGGSAAPTAAHTHTWTAPTLANGDVRPPFQNLLFIKASSPTTLPSGTIGMFTGTSSSLPANWTYYSAMQDTYLMGSSATTTGGSATHTHATSSDPFSTTGVGGLADGGNGNTSAAFAHGHLVARTGSVANETNKPPYAGIVFAKLTIDNDPLPDGILAFFDNASLPTNWSVYSTSGSPYVGDFIQGTSTFGSTGGSSADHNHNGNVTFVSGASTSTLNNKTGVTSAWANSSHTHSVNFRIGAASSTPVYRDIMLGQYTRPSNSPPTVSAVVLNGSSAITLNPNVTTTITAVASTTDVDGNIRFATATVYRSSSGPTCGSSGLDCYQLASSSCLFLSSTSTVSCSANIYYFADATDSSSSYSSQNWLANITVTDASSSAGTASTTAGVELNTLAGISVSNTTTDYGTLSPNTDSTSTNQTIAVKNAGNSSTTLNLSGTALTSGGNSIATSSQHYATTTFTFSATSSALSDTATTVSGFGIPRPGLVTSSWPGATSLPSALERFGAFAYNSYLYAIGGSSSSTNDIGLVATSTYYSLIKADGSLNSWGTTGGLPAPLSDIGIAVNNGYVYAIGGLDEGSFPTSTVLYAQPALDGTVSSWSNTTALPSENYGGVTVVANNYIYLIGGGTLAELATSTVFYTSSTSNGTLNSWKTATALPVSLRSHTGVANNNYIYAVGGSGSGAVYYAAVNATGSIGAWTATTALATSSLSFSRAIVDGDFIYITGGIATSTVRYAPTNPNGTIGPWTTATALSILVGGHGAASYNGILYTLGGRKKAAIGYADVADVYYTNASTRNIYWGIQIPSGVATGTYSGTNTYTSVYSP